MKTKILTCFAIFFLHKLPPLVGIHTLNHYIDFCFFGVDRFEND